MCIVYHSQQYSIFIELVKKYFFPTFQSHRYHINIGIGWKEFGEKLAYTSEKLG